MQSWGFQNIDMNDFQIFQYTLYICTLQIWPDFAVKKEIANLKVKCENYTVGCDWKGFFKQLAVCIVLL